MKLFNSLTKAKDELTDSQVRIYSCGPTVYDHVHIGNLLAFTVADLLGRTLRANGHQVKHVMNITDIDDKTIKGSQQQFPDDSPPEALKNFTAKYEELFINDMRALGNDLDSIELVRATDSIAAMQTLITELHQAGIAYIAQDGVYFSIEKYKASGKKYGQLVKITAKSTGAARVDNDEYDKDHIHDFALWKKQRDNEPAWDFELDGVDLTGRPGWHIECSAMARESLGQPFTVHTGGIDLAFPHHENEIAQSTAASEDPVFSQWFVHNEHILVEGKKMSKSLNNFYTLEDVVDKDFDPLEFRLFILQGHYRKQANFSWDNLQAAANRYKDLLALAELRFQPFDFESEDELELIVRAQDEINKSLLDDLNTPAALAVLSEVSDTLGSSGISRGSLERFEQFLRYIDDVLGLNLLGQTTGINRSQQALIAKRREAKASQDYTAADKARDELTNQGISLNDTAHGVLWHRIR